MRVQVTQEDINEGLCGSAVSCAIAMALKRKTGREVRVSYDAVTVYGRDFEDRQYYRLSTPAKKFIAQFDSGERESLSPAAFNLGGMK